MPESVSGYLVVFKIKREDSMSNPAIVLAFDLAATNVLICLSWHKMSSAISFMQASTGVNRRVATSLFSATLANNTSLSSWGISSNSKDILNEVETAIMREDADEDQIAMISDMRAYNCRGNNIESKFQSFCDAMIKVMNTEGSGTHRHHHVLSSEESIAIVTCASIANSISQLIEQTISLLEK
eukprot:248559-Ditylum_brightwellii.AAC.1